MIVLSFMSLIFLQYFWVKDAITIQNSKYERDINTALETVSYDLLLSLADYQNLNTSKIDFKNPTIQSKLLSSIENIRTVDIANIVSQALLDVKIKSNFDFIILDGSHIIHQSANFNNRLSDIAHYSSLDVGKRYFIYLYVEKENNSILYRNWGIVVVMLLFTSLITFVFIISLRTLHGQRKATEVTSDFINNMTHEFKTPISVINLAAATIENPKVAGNVDIIGMYTKMIKEECNKMNKQVQRILDIAKNEEQGLTINVERLHINQLLQDLVNGYDLKLIEVDGMLITDFSATKDLINADPVHFTNMINTIMDNSVKYRRENTKVSIKISTKNLNNKLYISVSDNGLGMNKENLRNAFKKFYRAGSGNIHNVKGFGLGLTYVKNVVDAHKAKIEMESQVGKGTTVTICFDLI